MAARRTFEECNTESARANRGYGHQECTGCSQISKQIQTQRLNEAKSTGAETMVTACAKCQIHFKCAMQDEKLKLDVGINIKDLTEVFAENLH